MNNAPWRIPFGDLKIGPLARKRIAEALDSNWVSEGRLVGEFEEKFAEKFCWKHAIATSSGTDAGIVVWSAIRDLRGLPYMAQSAKDITSNKGYVITPACAFVATANCILAAGLEPFFYDIELETLNLSPVLVQRHVDEKRDLEELVGIHFIATMGKPTPVKEVAKIAEAHDLYLIGDFCEAHGARMMNQFIVAPEQDPEGEPVEVNVFEYADHLCDAAIYSFYAAHLIVGGEGGMICTDDDEIAELCRSIKSHGRPSGRTYFNFQRPGFNSKWNELCAAVALESLERFDETFTRRREVRRMLIEALSQFEDDLIIYRDGPGEVISPHAFPIVLKDEDRGVKSLYDHLEQSGIQVKTLFGSLPTRHKAFEFLGHKLGDFPVAERIGRTGLHFSTNEFMTEEDIEFVAERIGAWLRGWA